MLSLERSGASYELDAAYVLSLERSGASYELDAAYVLSLERSGASYKLDARHSNLLGLAAQKIEMEEVQMGGKK